MSATPPPVTIPTLITPADAAVAPFWQFPESWDAAAVSDFMAATTELETEVTRLAEAVEDARAEAESPAAVIAETRAALAKRRAERLALERDRAEDIIFAELAKEYGGEHRVGRVRTREGSIMIRPMTSAESDALALRCSNPQLSEIDKAKLYRDSTVGLVRHPSRAKLDELTNTYVTLWGPIYEARDAISNGLAETVAKKG